MAKMMKMKKSMKMMKKRSSMKKSMKKSIIARGKRARASVFRGFRLKTIGGLKKDDLKKNTFGKIVSKKASDAAKKRGQYKVIKAWNKSFVTARKDMGDSIKGKFVPIGGKSVKGKELLKRIKSYYNKEYKPSNARVLPVSQSKTVGSKSKSVIKSKAKRPSLIGGLFGF